MSEDDDRERKLPVSSEDWGYGSHTFMLKAALNAASRHGLLLGVIAMIDYLDEHARHLEDPESECEGPDLWEAFDILIQVALTGEYIETVDPGTEEYDIAKARAEEAVKPQPMDPEEIDAQVNLFKDFLAKITETEDPEPKKEDNEKGDDNEQD